MNKENTNNYIIVEQARANLFNAFSGLFCQPEKEIINDKELYKSLALLFKKLNIGNLQPITDLEEAKDKYTPTELLIEYTKLFIGPFKTLAPPYSSIYLGDKTVMNDVTMWVLQQYNQIGLDFNIELRDLPDHIAVECEYLYYIIYKEITCLTNDDMEEASVFYNTRNVFLNDHFAKWVPRFCEQGIENTDNEYYIALFKLLLVFLHDAGIYEVPY